MRKNPGVGKNESARGRAQPDGEAERYAISYRTLIESFTDGLIVLDKGYRCTYANAAAATLLKTTPDKLIGRIFWEVVAQPRCPQLHEQITRAVEQKVFVKFEEYCEACGHWYEWRCYPSDAGLTIFLADATEHKQIEEQVARSEQHYRLLFETMPQGVVYQDADGKILSMNPAAEQILGRMPAEFLGRVSADEEYYTLHEDGSPFLSEDYPSTIALRTGQEVRGVVMGVYNPRERAYRWIDITAVPLIRPGEEKPYQVYTHFRDITELRQTEKALQHSERRFRKLFEGDLMGVFITRPDGTFLDCNDALVKMLGYDLREEVLRHRSLDFYVDPEFRREAVRMLQEEGIYLGKEGRVWRKDGSIAHLLGAAVLLKDEETGEPYIQGIAVDITERRRAEDALRDSEERYRKLFESNLAGVYLTRLDGTILDFNDAMMKMLGYDSREEVFQHRSTDFYADPEFRKELLYLLQRDGIVPGKEALLQRKDGAPLYALGAAVLLTNERTGEQYIQGVAVDITDRRRAEQALQELNNHLEEEVAARTEELSDTVDRLQNEVARRVMAEHQVRKHSQMLEAFFEHTITPLAFLDKHFNFTRVNKAYAQAAGRDPDYFVGKNYFVLHPREEDRAIFEHVVHTKQPYFARARPFVDPDNPERPAGFWDWQLTPLLSDTGQVQSLVLNLENVTEQQKAYSELKDRAGQLQRLMLELTQAEDRERKRVAEILHDDLQQVLAAAKFHLGLLDSGFRSPEESREIARQVKLMLKDAIEKSRSLSHELSPAVLYQSDLDDTFTWLARQMHDKYDLTVHLDIRGPVALQSEALRVLLYKATQELLFNVVKHARSGEAWIRLRRLRGYVCLSVSDKGRGFDPEQLQKVTGFGLLNIRERVSLLGGRMKIKSTKGKGSTFHIVVPCDELPGKAVGVEPSAEGRGETGSRARDEGDGRVRVLLADDHEIVRQGMALLLSEQPNIEVVGQASNGREAINLSYELRPDVVVMDVSMPLMNGDEATRQIKRHVPGTRVVALSMYDEAETIERMYEAGAESYVLKNAPSEELLAAIRGK